jgi:hypothetical protein
MLILCNHRGIIHLEYVITVRKMNTKTPQRKKKHIASTGEKTPLILALQEG